ncbi:MAG: protein tyrosine phosphatase family protein [Scytolyngbya sp. HA4215-MV1]|jgi:protein tyrosine phosphatase (PTP) superfamily phosphohydrolase (DUF442 family)|nr:protein tyrosine phosphatase family protein [Scytolyngbya sp. HA4215-MV1]
MSSLEAIYQFLKISDGLATAGQPTAEQFALIQATGYQVVVNLALLDSPRALQEEETIVQSLGMQYIHIPVVWENPTISEVQQFFQVMQENADRPVFVHCAANMRVSAFVYLYRRVCLRIDEVTAKNTLQQIWTPNDRWQALITQVLQQAGIDC